MQAEDQAIRNQRGRMPEPVVQASPEPQTVRSASLLTWPCWRSCYTLYIGKELLLPITLALLFKLLLQAPMRLLTTRLRLPSPVAAVLVILALFGCIALMALAVSVPASDWIAKAPQSLGVLQEKLAILRAAARSVAEGAARTGAGDHTHAARRAASSRSPCSRAAGC